MDKNTRWGQNSSTGWQVNMAYSFFIHNVKKIAISLNNDGSIDSRLLSLHGQIIGRWFYITLSDALAILKWGQGFFS